ncbi:hypothetical protein [Klebsiella aerogenes]|uniref:hypothetical protein n=1 Tax=Klebsiella aerogenes TaxID=548 RepID=UPI00351D1F76
MAHKKSRMDFETKVGTTPTNHYLDYFRKMTPLVPGPFLEDEWEKFKPTERRIIHELNEAYPDWLECISQRIEGEVKDGNSHRVGTFLQNFALTTWHCFDSFLRFVLNDLSDEDDLENGLRILHELNAKGEVEDPDFASPHERGLRKGLDTVLSQLNPEGMDKFESACYIFTLAYHYLSAVGDENRHDNALLEAAAHLGEFRGWYSNVQDVKRVLSTRENAQKAAKAKADGEFGAHKKEIMRIMCDEKEVELLHGEQSGSKAQYANHWYRVLGARLDQYAEQEGLNESKDSVNLIKGWVRKDPEFEDIFKILLKNAQTSK